MALNGDEFLAQLLETFRGEAQEHLTALSAGLLLLEQSSITPDEFRNTIEAVFRETHSLKGAARAVGLHDIESLCQQQESVFSAIKKGTLTLKAGEFDLFHEVIRTLERLLENEKGVKTDHLIKNLKSLLSGESASVVPVIEKPAITPVLTEPDFDVSTLSAGKSQNISSVSLPVRQGEDPEEEVVSGRMQDTIPEDKKGTGSGQIAGDGSHLHPPARGGSMIKISSDRLENLFARSDDLMGARLAAGQRSASLRDLLQKFMSWRWAWSQITTDLEYIRTGTESRRSSSPHQISPETERVIGFLEYNLQFFRSVEEEMNALSRAATRDQYLLDTATIELIEEIKRVILVPASSLLDIYPRAARDLARDSGKEVDVIITGAEIEIDRRILESIRDPLLHIIRNSIDHGIEGPEERLRIGKTGRGRIEISVSHVRGHQVEIIITDDGRGIDTHAVLASAVARGLISPEEGARMDPDQIGRLIFKSGLSTKKSVSTLSGRGLGLAIALEKTEQVGGSIRLDPSGPGTRFVLTLPLSLATFRGIRVYAGSHPFYLPLRSVDRVIQIRNGAIKTIENRMIVELDDEPLAVASLSQAIGFAEDPSLNQDQRYLVIVSASGIRFGLLVDAIAGVQEIVVKDLGRQLRRIRHFSGASIQGDGMVIPVINCEDLAATISGMETYPEPLGGISGESVQHRILVAEDSITSRMLLKNILEGAGYEVETAVDGVDAFSKLKTSLFEIVVSDVDMPRMNGFSLTEKIRGDPGLSEIPVILVTSLDSREDREHGITVGASAYIVKSSFDQSNLLEVISRHIS